MEAFSLKRSLDQVRSKAPLIHAITNYVTVNDCANALLAIGASPIMSDEPQEVEDITKICEGLTLNMGTLHTKSIESMFLAGRLSGTLGHPLVLDPVGAGASPLRSDIATSLVDELPLTVIRANMSEIKALAQHTSSTRGVDVCQADITSENNLAHSARFVCDFAQKTGSVLAITGAIDVISDGQHTYALRNGSPLMGRITGTGCMLSCLCTAFVAANPTQITTAVVAACASMGIAGQIAQDRLGPAEGSGSFRTYLLDALFCLDADTLERSALIDELCGI